MDYLMMDLFLSAHYPIDMVPRMLSQPGGLILLFFFLRTVGSLSSSSPVQVSFSDTAEIEHASSTTIAHLCVWHRETLKHYCHKRLGVGTRL